MFSVIERTSIKWYHEIFRKYAEGVTGLKPRVKRSGTLGAENECRPLWKERQMLAVFLHERLAGSQIVWIRARRYTNVCRSFRADGLFISRKNDGLGDATDILFAGEAFAESMVQERNHYQYRAKHHTRQNAIRRRNLGSVICQHLQNRSQQKYDRREAVSLSPEPDANGHQCDSKQ